MPSSMASARGAKTGRPFLTTVEAADFVGLSPRTLEKMRVHGGGPVYRKHGRYVRYHVDDLTTWSTGRARQSTSDAAAPMDAPTGDGHVPP